MAATGPNASEESDGAERSAQRGGAARPPVRIGLTGSMGSGKSTVARMFEEFGARVIDADALAREVLVPRGAALAEAVEAFGAEILGADGALDRARLAERVFSDRGALERLNAIVHPRVRERELALIDGYEREGASAIVLDVPLLFETGLDAHVDCVVVVVIEEDARFRRLEAARGLGREEIERRLASQAPQSEKRKRADHIIDNSGSRTQTRRQAQRVLAEILRGPGNAGGRDHKGA